MKILKLDPMMVLIVIVAIGVAVTMTTQASDHSSQMSVMAQQSVQTASIESPEVATRR